MYQVVERDIEEELGYLHPEEYKTLKEARSFVKDKQEELGEYYDVFIVEVD